MSGPGAPLQPSGTTRSPACRDPFLGAGHPRTALSHFTFTPFLPPSIRISLSQMRARRLLAG